MLFFHCLLLGYLLKSVLINFTRLMHSSAKCRCTQGYTRRSSWPENRQAEKNQHGNTMQIRKNALVVGAVITLATWLLMVFGAFQIPDGIIYNSFVRLSPPSAASASNLLIVKAGLERLDAGDDVWLTLLRELQRQQARQVVFTFLPARVSKQFYKESLNSAVIFGRHTREGTSGTNLLSLEPFPASAAHLTHPFGLLIDPPDLFGMHHYQPTNAMVAGLNYPSLEAAAAGLFSGSPTKTVSPIMVNFLGRAGGLPQVTLERALGGGLTPELVRGKSVVIGFSDSAHEPRLSTPLDRDISLLDYRAYALDTLIAEKPITEIPLLVQLLFVALMVFSALALQRLLEMRSLTWLTLAAATAYLAGCWLLLLLGHVWFPVTAPLMAISLTYLLIFRQRVMLAEEAVDSMLLSLSAKLKQSVLPESFYSSQEYWAQVITLVNQTLNLTRAIFLEKVPGDHRIREVKALHCSITDISELRRDYNRTPYSTAIASGGPIRIEGSDYLIRSDAQEEQYLVPLIFGGQPLGFWAFGIEPEAVSKIPHFQGTIRDFGKQISELLFRRQEWQLQQLRKNSFVSNYLDLSRDIPHEEMRKSLDLFERRFTTLETVFAELGTATILYDLFGRVLLVNRRMLDITREAGLLLYQMTALDLAITLSGLSREEIRRHLHTVLVEQAEITLSTSRFQGSRGNYILHIRPLVASEQKIFTAEACPFSTYGILLELIDVSGATSHERIKDKFIGKLSLRMSGMLIPMAAAMQQLQEDQLDPVARQTLVAGLQEKITESLSYVQHISRNSEEELPISGQEVYPVDGLHLLREAACLAERDLFDRRVTTSIVVPATMPFVWASSRALEVVFRSFFVMLGNAAALNSTVRVDAAEEEDAVAFRFSSNGFSMPRDVLHRNIFSDELTDSVQHRRARASARNVQQWQGTVEAASGIGGGTSVFIRLRKFNGEQSSSGGSQEQFRAEDGSPGKP